MFLYFRSLRDVFLSLEMSDEGHHQQAEEPQAKQQQHAEAEEGAIKVVIWGKPPSNTLKAMDQNAHSGNPQILHISESMSRITACTVCKKNYKTSEAEAF